MCFGKWNIWLLTSPGGVAVGIVVVSCAALKSVNANGLKVAPHSAICPSIRHFKFQTKGTSTLTYLEPISATSVPARSSAGGFAEVNRSGALVVDGIIELEADGSTRGHGHGFSRSAGADVAPDVVGRYCAKLDGGVVDWFTDGRLGCSASCNQVIPDICTEHSLGMSIISVLYKTRLTVSRCAVRKNGKTDDGGKLHVVLDFLFVSSGDNLVGDRRDIVRRFLYRFDGGESFSEHPVFAVISKGNHASRLRMPGSERCIGEI